MELYTTIFLMKTIIVGGAGKIGVVLRDAISRETESLWKRDCKKLFFQIVKETRNVASREN